MDTAPKKTTGNAIGDMAELIQLILSEQPDYTIEDPNGYVSHQIRKLGNLPDTPAIRSIVSKAIKLLENNNRILREKSSPHRTIMIKLNTQLMSDYDLESLWNQSEAIRTRASDIFREVAEQAGEYSFDRLVEDCQTAYEAFQQALRDAPEENRMQSNSQAALMRGSSILSEVGLHNNRARIVRHYLKELNLAKTMRRVANSRYDWYWWVNTIEFRPAVLHDRVQRDGRIWQPPKGVNPYRPWWEDTSRERRFAGDTPAVLPDDLCSPVRVARVNTKVDEMPVKTGDVEPIPAPEPVQISEEKPPVSPDDIKKPSSIQRLGTIIDRLEKKVAALQAGNAAKDKEIRQLKLDKQALEAALQTAVEKFQEDATLVDQYLRKYPAN